MLSLTAAFPTYISFYLRNLSGVTGEGQFGDEVVWLAPKPDAPFRRLTALVGSEFGTAPYVDAYEDVEPHLTLADYAAVEHMRSAEAIARELLPFGSRAVEVTLVRGGPPGWAEVRRFPLG